MARLRNAATGVVVNVDDGTASRLGSEWKPFPKGSTVTPGRADGAPKGNASREEWADYADSLGVDFDDDAKRDDIKAAIAAAAEPGPESPSGDGGEGIDDEAEEVAP